MKFPLALLRSILLLCFFIHPTVSATEKTHLNNADTFSHSEALSRIEALIGKAKLQQASASRQWHALMYYNKKRFSNQYKSEIDDSRFFISKNGAHDPYAELVASVESITKQRQDNDQAFSCRFPARTAWIKQTLLSNKEHIDNPVTCTKFEQWKNDVAATGASVIFPAAYLDSPSSMFGHTLIRLDKADKNGEKERNSLLDYTVSYAAEKKPTDSELAFVYKGLVGGYPGITSVRPYYQKLKEYSDIESRDIWEYTLNISQNETDQLVRHIWEVQNVDIDYFFFTENCSYRVLGLLDVLRPNTPLLADYPAQVIPVETVRSLLERHWVKDIHYRPSVMTKFNHQLSQLSPKQREQIKHWVDSSENIDFAKATQNMDENTRRNMLDVAYRYARLTRKTSASKGSDKSEDNKEAKSSNKTPKKTAYQLLITRQKTPGENTLTPPPEPFPRDDQGHLSNHISFSYGETRYRNKDTNFTEFTFKPAYHSLNDPAKGYPLGSELEFLNLRFRYELDDESSLNKSSRDKNLSLEHLTLIGIQSIKTMSLFFKPLSWSVELGAQRVSNHRSDASQIETSLAPFASGQFGPAIKIGPWLSYAMIGAEGMIAKNITKGHDIRAKMTLGSIAHFGDFQTLINYEFSDSYLSNQLNQSFASQALEMDLAYTLSQNTSITFNAKRLKEASLYKNESKVGFNYFF